MKHNSRLPNALMVALNKDGNHLNKALEQSLNKAVPSIVVFSYIGFSIK